MFGPSPSSAPLLLPFSMACSYNANMDALPLELKQRICSFLTPKELKPLRLTCKIFAAAAERFFINRFVLFIHPDSLATLRKIVDHEIFHKYLNTIVYDPSILTDVHTIPVEEPHWDDFRPKTLSLDSNESYATITNRLMREATERYQAAWKETEKPKAQLQDLLCYQHSWRVVDAFAKEIKYALLRCQRLRNIVFSSHRPYKEARDQLFMIRLCTSWNIIRRYHQDFAFSGTDNLESLTLMRVKLPGQVTPEDAQAMRNLKHLRIDTAKSTSRLSGMQPVFEIARRLETLSLSASHFDITKTIKGIRSSSLRVCLVDFKHVEGHALIEFLLHHARSLQRLALGLGSSDIGWAPVLCGISGKFPNLKRVQLELLQSRWNRFSMRRDAELQAERFVLSGGLLPLLQYTSLDSAIGDFTVSGRGFYTNGDSQVRLPSGLWPDYESLANESWDGFGSESTNEEEDEEDDEQEDEDEEDEGENEDD